MALPTRAWTVTISAHAGRPTLACTSCRPFTAQPGIPVVRQAHRHLAGHLVDDPLPAYLRTCQCREYGCRWHRHPAPCSGPLHLLLICTGNGRTWHLADACLGCARTIPRAASVREPDGPAAPAPRPASVAPEAFGKEQEWVEAL
ncbi:hypothetical protein [Streptomyces cyaneofuscatus]|uniref:hypothetical protein n=1 Tax=Streptomyces cyaneofuscatus TaxID=66883 RepID=UPI0033AD04E4